jgi:hypothetical protein
MIRITGATPNFMNVVVNDIMLNAPIRNPGMHHLVQKIRNWAISPAIWALPRAGSFSTSSI